MTSKTSATRSNLPRIPHPSWPEPTETCGRKAICYVSDALYVEFERTCPEPIVSSDSCDVGAPSLLFDLSRRSARGQRELRNLRFRRLVRARWSCLQDPRFDQDAFGRNRSATRDRASLLRPRSPQTCPLQSREHLFSRYQHLSVLREASATLATQPRPRDSPRAGGKDDVGKRCLLLHPVQPPEGRAYSGTSRHQTAKNSAPTAMVAVDERHATWCALSRVATLLGGIRQDARIFAVGVISCKRQMVWGVRAVRRFNLQVRPVVKSRVQDKGRVRL